MKRRASYQAAQVLVCSLTLALAFTPASRAADKSVNLHESPNGKAPVDVSVGLYITNVVAIDETRENFEVGGFLTAEWQDPRLALAADQASDKGNEQDLLRTLPMEDVWSPSIQGANTISHTTLQYSLEADKRGDVTYRERFEAILSSDFSLRKFPFDTQVLRFEYQPFLSTTSRIHFNPQALPGTGISPTQHTDLAAWHLEDLTYTTDKMTDDALLPPMHEALFQIVAVRRSAFYVWKIFLPLMMMALVPSVVFWIDVKEFDWLLKIPMTMLLSMVAFQFTVTRDLPRIGYMTFLDAVFLVSFIFCFLGIFEITLVYLLQKYDRRLLALRLHRTGRWVYPGAYFGIVVTLAIGFLA
jgi:Neurotransmitter-gated ion-channel ligand binding domain